MELFKRFLSLFKTYTLDDLDLTEKVKLKFNKSDYGEYIVSFYHPLFNEWWELPDSSSAIHARWSLLKRGSYGAYDLHKLKCSFAYIDKTRESFKTIGDIVNHFNQMNKQYESFKAYMDFKNKLPNEIR